MKYVSKFLLLLVTSLIFAININAEEDNDTEISELGEKQVLNCTDKTVTLTGCFYNDETASKYENIPSKTQINAYTIGHQYSAGTISSEMKYFFIDNITFERAYTSINKNGDSVVGACYKGYVHRTDAYENSYPSYQNPNDHYYIDTVYSTPQDSDNDLAFIYLRIFNKKCDTAYRDQIIFQDTEKARKKYINLDVSHYNDTVAVRNIDTTGYEGFKTLTCPKYMSFSENMSGVATFFHPEYEYIFSDSEEVRHKNNWLEKIVGVDVSGRITGCTEKSKDYDEDLTACIEEKAKLVSKYTCPDKLTDINIDTKTYIDSCAEEYSKKHNVDIESARYLANQTEEYAPKLKKAGNDKIDECYQKAWSDKCKLTSSEISSVRNKMKGTMCETGCKIAIREEENDNKEGKCVACGGSNGVVYYWKSKDAAIGGSCVEAKLDYDNCLGNSNTSACRECYDKACSELSAEKKTCLLNLIAESQQAISNNENNVDNAFEEHENETNEKNAEKIREIYNNSFYTFIIPGVADGGFGPKGQNCSEILKNNGVKIIKGIVNVLRIAAAIIAIANAMIVLIPAVISKDADGLKKAGRKLVVMAVVLAIVGILPSIVYLIGVVFGYDLSCIF